MASHNSSNGDRNGREESLVERYERLRKSIQSDGASAHKGEADDLVVERLAELEHIYELVKRQHSTKIHLKDAEVFMDASEIAATNAKNIKLGEVGITLNTDEVVQKLEEYLKFSPVNEPETPKETFQSFNWAKLATLYYSVSAKPLFVDSLYGPLETERRRVGTRTRNIDDSNSTRLTTATSLQSQDIDGGEEKNTAYMVKRVYQTFLEKNGGEEINFFHFFVNPSSFAQSVENLFFTSFLIRDARLKLYEKDGVPTLVKTEPQEQYDAQTSSVQGRHYISTLTFGSWQHAIEKYNIVDLFLPDRGT